MHHDLCFGCGLANVFGLQLDLEERGNGVLGGRFFVKQDHQGPPGQAHPGVLASALVEAMSLAVEGRGYARAAQLELELRGAASIGTYLEVEARTAGAEAGRPKATAELRDREGKLVAEAGARFLEAEGQR
jgi:acyl-coenzyme A thioesterase PaaI-like protein